MSALVVQALRHTGKNRLDQKLVSRLQTLLSGAEKRNLIQATRFGADWIYETAKKIAAKSP